MTRSPQRWIAALALLISFAALHVVGAPTPAPNTTTSAPTPTPSDIPALEAGGYFTIVVVVLVLAALVLDFAPCTSVMFCAGLAFRLGNVITTEQFFDGLSETGVVTIGLLFIVVGPIPNLPIVRQVIALILDGKYQLLKMCLICYALSWCTGNVPLVVLLLPIVKSYCRDHKLAPSQMLMSMNAATLLGGSFSVIGTSSNLVYSTLMHNQGLPDIGFFEMAKISLAPAVVALVYLAYAPQYLLPKHSGGLLRKLRDDSPTFVAQFRVLAQSPLVGRPSSDVQEHLPKSTNEAIMIVEIRATGLHKNSGLASPRGGATGVSKDSPRGSGALSDHRDGGGRIINVGDRIVLAGAVADLHVAASLLHMSWEPKTSASNRRRSGGEVLTQGGADSSSPDESADTSPQVGAVAPVFEDAPYIPSEHTNYFEVVIGNNCPCIGRLVGEGIIDTRYNASLLSLRRRDGQDLVNEEDIAGHEVAVGDTLLLLAPETLPEQFGSDFFVVSQLQVPHHVHPFIIEVPDVCCIGRYVSVDVSSGSHGGHGATGGGTAHRPQQRTPPRRTAMHVDGDDGAATSPLSPEKNESMTDLNKPLNAAAHSGDGSAPRRFTATKKVIVLPDAYRNVALLVFVGMVAASVSGVSIELAAACAATLLVVLRLVPLRDALKSLDLDLLIMIAFSFTLGSAITSTHVADNLSKALSGHGLKGLPLLLVISFVTMFFTNAITSKACAQVMVPLTVSLCRTEGIDPFPACMLLTCTTASSLITPYGHPSNLLIFGPGGYKPIDFVKFGLPLNIFLCVAMSVMTAAVYDQW